MNKLFWAEGYRAFFAFFPLAGLLFLGLWMAALGGAVTATPVDHATAMIWGVYGSAVLGFLLTAYPRQNDATPPSPGLLVAFFAGQVVTVGALAASWLGAPTGHLATVAGVGVWGALSAYVARIAVPSLRRKWDSTTAIVPFAVAAGLVGWLCMRLGAPVWGRAFGVHGFLVLLALGLLDRLLPFFSSKVVPGYDGVRHPGWAARLLGVTALRVAFPDVATVPDLLMAGVIVGQWIGWRPFAGARVPLLGVLHLGVAWLVLGYVVDATQALPPTLALHLWTVGGMGTLLLGLASRVALGHGGQPLRLGNAGALALGLLQGAAVVRALGPLVLPPLSAWHASAALLALALLTWGARFAPLTTRKG